MLIENQEALKSWLTTYIEPLCDADPAALAKYVIALIKKDKPMDELRESMEQQMDVFLQSETKNFIDILFKSLETKEYLNPPQVAAAVKEEAASPPHPPREEAKEEKEGEKNGSENKQPDSTTPTREDPKEEPKPLGRRTEADRDGERYRSRRRSPSYRRRYEHRRGFRSRSRSPGAFGRRSRSPSYRRRRSSPPLPSFGGRRSVSPPSRRSPSSGGRRIHSRDSTPTRDDNNDGLYTPTATTKKRPPRCRDYDEKGFCMRGDMCKFDHGVDAVVLDDVAAAAAAVPPVPATAAPYLPAAAIPYTPADPYVPVSTVTPPVVLPPLHVPPPGYAIPPPIDVSRKRSYEESSPSSNGYPPQKRFDYNRLGFNGRGRGRGRGGRGRGGGNVGGLSVNLAVRNIPPMYNTIAHLNNHFSRFGCLVNVQVQFEGDPGSALVTFSSPAEAEAAINSAEAVMGNRFIKMYYHGSGPQSAVISVKDRLGSGGDSSKDGDNVVRVLHGQVGQTLTKTISNPQKDPSSSTTGEGEAAAEVPTPDAAAQRAEEKAVAIAAIQKNQEMLEMKAQLKKEQEDKKKEALKRLSELQKSKQELLEKLIAQQKVLICKLEKDNGKAVTPEERSEIMKLLKALSVSIDKARLDVKKAMASALVRKTPGELQKELLDAELELFNKQQDGSDTAEIQQRVNQLKIEAARTGILPTSKSPRGMRGYYRGRGYRGYNPYRGRGGHLRGSLSTRGRGFVVGSTSVDRRPSKILVSGFEPEDKEEVILHFQKFGEITETIQDDATPSFIFHYKSRRDAEGAMAGGKTYGDRLLQLSWYTNSNAEEFTELEGEAETGEEEAEEEDDYTPLDPAYLPPGLGEDGTRSGGHEHDKNHSNSKVSKQVTEEKAPNEELNADDLLYQEDEEEEEEEEEEENEERSWKR